MEEIEFYKKRCSELEQEVRQLKLCQEGEKKFLQKILAIVLEDEDESSMSPEQKDPSQDTKRIPSGGINDDTISTPKSPIHNKRKTPLKRKLFKKSKNPPKHFQKDSNGWIHCKSTNRS